MGKSFVYNTGSSEDVIPIENIELPFGLFFDGTLNNLGKLKYEKFKNTFLCSFDVTHANSIVSR
jgi:hypothetical protein